jgi:hypothetical protein
MNIDITEPQKLGSRMHLVIRALLAAFLAKLSSMGLFGQLSSPFQDGYHGQI